MTLKWLLLRTVGVWSCQEEQYTTACVEAISTSIASIKRRSGVTTYRRPVVYPNQTRPNQIKRQFLTSLTLTPSLAFKMVRTGKFADFSAVSRPFRAHVDIEDVEVEGDIPTELDGTFYRVRSANAALHMTQR